MTARLPLLAVTVIALSQLLLAQVSSDRLLNAQKESQNWLTYSGGYMSQRHSQLTQITPANVKDLELKWVFQARWLDYNQATPLVVDGVMYTTQGNDVVALDAATGKIFWIYPYTPTEVRLCCGRITRGLAIHGDTLFLAAADAHLIAIDAKTGRPIWHRIVATGFGYSMTTAPLVIKDKVIVGTAGGEFGIRGFLAAFDVATGKEAWRFNTVPLPGEPGHETWGDGWKHGGGSIWVTGSYDPETNLTFWGVGNPGPDYNAETRPGDNLYTLLGRRAGCRHGKAAMALPVHARRRIRLGRGADSGAGRHHVEGATAKGHAVGQPQRLLLRARSQDRRVSAGHADRQTELERGVR